MLRGEAHWGGGMVCSVSAERESKMEIEKSIRFSNTAVSMVALVFIMEKPEWGHLRSEKWEVEKWRWKSWQAETAPSKNLAKKGKRTLYRIIHDNHTMPVKHFKRCTPLSLFSHWLFSMKCCTFPLRLGYGDPLCPLLLFFFNRLVNELRLVKTIRNIKIRN